MLGLILSALLTAPMGSAPRPCAVEEEGDVSGHLEQVCSEIIGGAPTYAVTFRASLAPQPAAQQVLLYRLDGAWMLRVAGYRWQPGGPVETRRHELPIAARDAEALAALLDDADFDRLGQLFYYGRPDAVCSDGSSVTLARSVGGMVREAGQHSCAGKTEVHRIAAAFRRVALRYDPAFDGLLAGLKD